MGPRAGQVGKQLPKLADSAQPLPSSLTLFLALVAKHYDADVAPVRHVKCAIKTFLNDTRGGSCGLELIR